MRLWLGVLVSVLFSVLCVFSSVAKNGERDYPGWFIVSPVEESAETPLTLEVQAKTPTVSKNEEDLSSNKSKEVLQRADKKKERPEEKHFAKNQKDLALAGNLLKVVYKENSESNFVVSPISFYAASVLVANGVVDETLFEFSPMFSVLHLSEVNKTLSDYMLYRKDSVILYNALWGKVFSEHYQSLMSDQLKAEVWSIKDTTQSLNDWAKARSRGIIQTFGEAEKVSTGDLFVTGMAYFINKSAPFFVQTTGVKQFFNLDGSMSKETFLQGEVLADYYEDRNMQVLRLSYPSGDNLTIFLPNAEASFEEFIEKFNVNVLKAQFEKKEVKVLLPKFDIEYALKNVPAIYETAGVKRIFEQDNYDFAKMVSFDDVVRIKKFFLKSRVIFGEDSSERNVENLSAKISFEADHPFIFMINDGDFIGAHIFGESQ